MANKNEKQHPNQLTREDLLTLHLAATRVLAAQEHLNSAQLGLQVAQREQQQIQQGVATRYGIGQGDSLNGETGQITRAGAAAAPGRRLTVRRVSKGAPKVRLDQNEKNQPKNGTVLPPSDPTPAS